MENEHNNNQRKNQQNTIDVLTSIKKINITKTLFPSVEKIRKRKEQLQLLELQMIRYGGSWENVENKIEQGLDTVDAILMELDRVRTLS